VRKYLYGITARRPIVLPIVTPVGESPEAPAPEESSPPAEQ
jgi:hypothetical protein